MTLHTPGPWRFEFYKNDSDEYCHRVVGSYIDKNGWPDIVCDNEPYYPHQVSEADARLIAAAPDLLEALKKIASLGMSQFFTQADFADECQNIARAAIAKATGEQP